MKKSKTKDTLTLIRHDIQRTELILIVVTIILLSFGGALINISSSNKYFNQNLHNTSELITRLYDFTKDFTQDELCSYFDNIVKDLENVDVVSIVDTSNKRIYHTNHSLINTEYDGTQPDFIKHKNSYYIEKDKGPSGSQKRIYSAIYDSNGNYSGFIMTIELLTSIRTVTCKTVMLFLFVTVASILIELIICRFISGKINKRFLSFTEDFEGTKFLVDSMRANNHDFTNKLHVILGLIQIGQYQKAVSYIENISIIQRETISAVMNAIDNPSFAALLIGKIARASECNVKFILKDNSHFNSSDINIPSEALVTITGNLIDNALDSMNMTTNRFTAGELTFGVFSHPDSLFITVQDNGEGISNNIKDRIFENGFSTKGNGRGIGLYRTKQLVESLGGTISFESKKDKGCCFMVNLKKRS